MNAAGVPDSHQTEIARSLDAKVRNLWASGAASVANVRLYMEAHCRQAAKAAGITLDGPAMAALCRPPANFVGHPERKRARIAHIKRSDAGGYAAKYVPRVRRHRDDLAPLDLVAGDVWHSDILVRRTDGSLASPKIVAFQDLATNRLFTRTFLMQKGEMIRREHVLGTLRDLMADPAWGVPRTLYLDNGSEFQTLEAADDLARLSDMVRDIHKIEQGIVPEEDRAPAGILRSRPYNPQSKVIESIFSAFTRSIEAEHSGFVGGNRMAKKVENQGRAPVPMDGDAEAIVARFQSMVDFYNARPQQRGAIKGKSPNMAFNAAVEAGWRAIVLDPREFALAFGRDDTRTVQLGGELQIDNRIYRHDNLAVMVGERVRVRVPILGDGSRVVVLTDKGEPRCVAAEAPSYSMRDLAGTREHDRRRRSFGLLVAEAGGPAKPECFAIEQAAFIGAQVPVSPAPPMAVASVHPILRDEATRGPAEAVPMRPGRAARDAQREALHALADSYRSRERAR